MTDVNDGGVIDDAGGNTPGNPSWMASLPDAHKENESFSQFKEPKEAWDKFDTLLKAEGSTITIPGEGATDAEKTAYLTAIGRPEKAEGYEFAKPSELPEGITYSEEVEGSFKAKFHELGLSTAQASGLYDFYMNWWMGGIQTELSGRETAKTQASDSLKTEMGVDYDTNIALMGKAIEKFGGEEFKKYMDDSGVGNDPAIIKTFINIGKAMSEDTLIMGDKGADGRQRGPDGRIQFEYANSPELKT